MNTFAWVSIGICAANMAFTVIYALMKRPGRRIDKLEAAVFGETGVSHRLHKYVTVETFEKRMGTIDEHLKGVLEEGNRREDRILAAIGAQGSAIHTSIGELKADVRAQAGRIDEVMRTKGGR